MTRRELTLREKEFARRYLNALEEIGIPSILLRNYDEFPNAIGNDIDLFVPRADLKSATRLFVRVLTETGGQLLMRNRRDYVLDLRILFDGTVENALHIDLYHGAFTWHGQPYLATEKLLADSVVHRSGFRVPRAAHEALNLVFASLLWGGFFKERYQPRIAELLRDPTEHAEFTRCVEQAFGTSCAIGFDPTAADALPKALTRQSAHRLRRALTRVSFSRDKIGTPIRWIRHWLIELWTVARPRGLHIAILSQDKLCGTMVLAALEKSLPKVFVDTHVHTAQPPAESEVSARGEGLPITYSLSWILRNLATYIVGYGFRIIKRKAQSHLIIDDHHPIELWCDQAHYQFRVPLGIVRALCAIVPLADFTFIIRSESTPLTSRKGKDFLKDRNLAQTSCCRSANNSDRKFVLDPSKGANALSKEIETIIAKFLVQRER